MNLHNLNTPRPRTISWNEAGRESLNSFMNNYINMWAAAERPQPYQRAWMNQYAVNQITADDLRYAYRIMQEPRARWGTPADENEFRAWLARWYYWPNLQPGPREPYENWEPMGRTLPLYVHPRGATYADWMNRIEMMVQQEQRAWPQGQEWRTRVALPGQDNSDPLHEYARVGIRWQNPIDAARQAVR